MSLTPDFYSYIVGPFAFFIVSFWVYNLRNDSKSQKQRGGAPLPLPEKLLRNSRRTTLVMSTFMMILGLELTGYSYFESTSFTMAGYIAVDMKGMKNIFHGGLLLAAYSNFTQSGNARYFLYCSVPLLHTIVACVAHMVVTGTQISKFGKEQAGPSFLVALTFFLICGVTVASQLTAFSKTRTNIFTAVFQMMQNGKHEMEARLGSQYPLVRRIKGRLFVGLMLEVVLFVLYNIGVVFANLYPDEPILFRDFVNSFIDTVTMSIHFGFVTTNGITAVRVNCVDSCESYAYAKQIFTAMALLEFARTLYGFLVVQQHLPDHIEWTHRAVCEVSSMGFLLLYASIQAVNLHHTTKFQVFLRHINFKYTHVVASTTSSSIGIWKFAHLQDSNITPGMQKWAKVAAVAVVCLFLIRLAGCVVVIGLSPTSIHDLGESLNFSLHAAVLFFWQFFRSVQDYQDKLQRSKNFQAGVFLLFFVRAFFQFASIQWIVYKKERALTDNHIYVLLYIGARMLITLTGVWAFFKIKPPRKRNRRRIFCCLVAKEADYSHVRGVEGGDDQVELQTLELQEEAEGAPAPSSSSSSSLSSSLPSSSSTLSLPTAQHRMSAPSPHFPSYNFPAAIALPLHVACDYELLYKLTYWSLQAFRAGLY